ncbi:hypothetical protein GCM10027061_22110 [Nesterenkonia suensis]
MTTSPVTAAVGARKTPAPMDGVLPFTVRICAMFRSSLIGMVVLRTVEAGQYPGLVPRVSTPG